MNDHTRQRQGTQADLRFLSEDRWLSKAAVRYEIFPQSGRYWVNMIYIAHDNPFHFRIRPIDHYPSLIKAQQFAQIFLRGIRRDPRGTFKTDTDAFDLCCN